MKILIHNSFFMLFLLTAWAIPAHAQTNNGLVGWWRFDEGTGTSALDSSGSGNTGTLTAGPTWVVGKYGDALSFNGTSQYVLTSTAAKIPTIQGNLTYSAWIFPKIVTAVGDIVACEINGSVANQMRLNGSGEAEVSQWGGTVTITETSQNSPQANGT